MDRCRPPGDDYRRSAALLSHDRLRGVCLERTIELDNVRLSIRDWPGVAGPLVHVPDPVTLSSVAIDALAGRIAPRYRVLSVCPRGDSPYQVDATDLGALLRQFGFASPILMAEGLGCVTALVAAAWYPSDVAGLVLIDSSHNAPPDDSIRARALRECPPDITALRAEVRCAIFDDLGTFLSAAIP